MRKVGKALVLTGAALIMGALLFVALPTSAKVAKPQFTPGSRVVIEIGKWTIEATVADEQIVNRTNKASRLSPKMPVQVKAPFYRGPYVLTQSSIL